jgi:hypothetical protein
MFIILVLVKRSKAANEKNTCHQITNLLANIIWLNTILLVVLKIIVNFLMKIKCNAIYLT